MARHETEGRYWLRCTPRVARIQPTRNAVHKVADQAGQDGVDRQAHAPVLRRGRARATVTDQQEAVAGRAQIQKAFGGDEASDARQHVAHAGVGENG